MKKEKSVFEYDINHVILYGREAGQQYRIFPSDMPKTMGVLSVLRNANMKTIENFHGERYAYPYHAIVDMEHVKKTLSKYLPETERFNIFQTVEYGLLFSDTKAKYEKEKFLFLFMPKVYQSFEFENHKNIEIEHRPSYTDFCDNDLFSKLLYDADNQAHTILSRGITEHNKGGWMSENIHPILCSYTEYEQSLSYLKMIF